MCIKLFVGCLFHLMALLDIERAKVLAMVYCSIYCSIFVGCLCYWIYGCITRDVQSHSLQQMG